MRNKILAIIFCLTIIFSCLCGCNSNNDTNLLSNELSYSILESEFNYYYYETWHNYQTTAYNCEKEYGLGYGKIMTGYNYLVTPQKQVLTEDDFLYLGVNKDAFKVEEPTWADYFTYSAIQSALYVKYANENASKEKVSISTEQIEEIEKTISDIQDEAYILNLNANEYISQKYGDKITIEKLKAILTEQAISENFYEQLTKKLESTITIDELTMKYNSSNIKYDIATYRGCYILSEKNASEMVEKILDEKSFVELYKQYSGNNSIDHDSSTKNKDTKYNQVTKISETVADWIFSSERKKDDKKYFPIDNNKDGVNDTYYVVYIVEPSHRRSDKIASVRHIQFVCDEHQSTSLINEKKERANQVYSQYLKQPTEKNFISLVSQYTEDVKSKSNGGLYENISNDGTYYEAIANWATSNLRQPGDCEIVFSEHSGYHILYYVAATGEGWTLDVKDDVLSDKIKNYENSFYTDHMSNIDLQNKQLQKLTEKLCEIISTEISNYQK